VRLQSLTNVNVRGANIVGWRCWNDGVDIVSSQSVVVEDMFIRSDDDCIAVKGMDPTMDTKVTLTALVRARNST
jgi:polygalacturonase